MRDMTVSPQLLYEEAKKSLGEKDLVDFVTNISNSELLASDDLAYLPQITFLKVQGLFHLNQYRKALKMVPLALQHNQGREKVQLKNYQGVMIGYLGDFQKAEQIFKDNLDGLEEVHLLVETYLNIIWANLALYKQEQRDGHLVEAKKYLDLANEHFDRVDDPLKGRILDNLSVYTYLKGDYDQAIEIEEQAVQYFAEPDLPMIYNNLAAMYLEVGDPVGVCPEVQKYTDQVEIIGERTHNYIEVGKGFYTKAMAELREEQLFSALDTLYLSFEFFKKANALSWAFDCLMKINEIVAEYKLDRFKSLKETVKADFAGTLLFDKLN